jgi:hypothetical protein
MTTLLERVTATPARAVGAPDWFRAMSPADQQDIRDLLATRLRDDGTVQHSMVQLAEIVVEHYGLAVKPNSARMRLAELTREIQQCPKRPSKKK